MKITLMNDNWKKPDNTPDDLVYDVDFAPRVGECISVSATGKVGMYIVEQVVFAFDGAGLYTGYGVRLELLKPIE